MRNRASKNPQLPLDRILAVDDQTDNLVFLRLLLEAEGYEVETATNGLEALAKLEANPPDLLLLDLEMPEIDGYEIIRQVRQSKYTTFISIVLLTASGIGHALHGIKLGADAFLCLPFDLDELLSKIKDLLTTQETAMNLYS
jgi:CheY-like chemotaxis protein